MQVVDPIISQQSILDMPSCHKYRKNYKHMLPKLCTPGLIKRSSHGYNRKLRELRNKIINPREGYNSKAGFMGSSMSILHQSLPKQPRYLKMLLSSGGSPAHQKSNSPMNDQTKSRLQLKVSFTSGIISPCEIPILSQVK